MTRETLALVFLSVRRIVKGHDILYLRKFKCGASELFHKRGEESVQGFGGKARRKETTWKTKMWMGGWMESEWILRRLAGGVLSWLRRWTGGVLL
jgi:hypothetical protein